MYINDSHTLVQQNATYSSRKNSNWQSTGLMLTVLQIKGVISGNYVPGYLKFFSGGYPNVGDYIKVKSSAFNFSFLWMKVWELARWKNHFSLLISIFGLRLVFHLFVRQISSVEKGFRAVLNVTQSSHLIQTNFKFVLNSSFIRRT